MSAGKGGQISTPEAKKEGSFLLPDIHVCTLLCTKCPPPKQILELSPFWRPPNEMIVQNKLL